MRLASKRFAEMVILALFISVTLGASQVLACSYGDGAAMYAELIKLGKVEEAQQMVDKARIFGPERLQEMFLERDGLIESLQQATEGPAVMRLQKALNDLELFIDAVGGQRYCTSSRLFWYTDLEAAKLESKESGKPILSLRMLGKLTDELSCANSRFFRTTLYSNAEVSRRLRDEFVLHWESVRPVPVITIDFGDGRKLVRTITGNSAHYVLDSNGHAMDVLPGLYSPQRFISWLDRVNSLGKEVLASPGERDTLVEAYHRDSLFQLDQQWRADLETLQRQEVAIRLNRHARSQLVLPSLASESTGDAKGIPQAVSPAVEAQGAETPTAETPPSSDAPAKQGTIPAAAATAIAVPKRSVELKPLASVTMTPPVTSDTDDAQFWLNLAALHQSEVAFDETSRNVMVRENPVAINAARLAMSKTDIEGPMLAKLFSRLQSSVAIDTVRNEYQLHRQIHEWFIAGERGNDLVTLNERVYAELFLTPSNDPWLGLVERDVYTGLTNAGVAGGTEFPGRVFSR